MPDQAILVPCKNPHIKTKIHPRNERMDFRVEGWIEWQTAEQKIFRMSSLLRSAKFRNVAALCRMERDHHSLFFFLLIESSLGATASFFRSIAGRRIALIAICAMEFIEHRFESGAAEHHDDVSSTLKFYLDAGECLSDGQCAQLAIHAKLPE